MKANTFQLAIAGAFILFGVAGVAIFATSGGFGGGNNFGQVTVWGPYENSTFTSASGLISQTDDRARDITYVAKDPETYVSELVNELAAGRGPDLVILDHETLLAHRDKFFAVPLDTLSARDFRDRYIDEAELLLSDSGARALPLVVDPLVMYYNQALVSAAGLAKPPATWTEMLQAAEAISVSDGRGGLTRSAVALGAYDNIAHAKDILSLLFLQAEVPIIATNNNGQFVASLQGGTGVTAGGEAALRYYTQFADPARIVYSWNRSLPNSTTAFTSGTLAMYFGYASELPSLVRANPNLRFDVARVPQEASAAADSTFGRMAVLAIPRTAPNPNGAIQAALLLTSELGSGVFAGALGTPSANRNVLAAVPEEAHEITFRNSALIARGWYDVAPDETASIFKSMIDSVISGRLRLREAVNQAEQLLMRTVR